MKTLKTLITLLLLMICTAVEAQSIIVIEKTDGTTDEYNIAEVDSVAYVPKEEVKYYYYAGWTCPTDLTTLAQLAVAPNGGEINISKTYNASYPVVDFSKIDIYINEPEYYYMVIPNTMSIYNIIGTDVSNGSFRLETSVNIPNHNVYKTAVPEDTIGAFLIY